MASDLNETSLLEAMLAIRAEFNRPISFRPQEIVIPLETFQRLQRIADDWARALARRKRPSRRRIKARMRLRGLLTERDRIEFRIKPPAHWKFDIKNDTWYRHASSCAVYNAPAFAPGPCDCGSISRWMPADEYRPQNDRSQNLGGAAGV